MASFNRVILMGNLTRDIELRYTPGGMAVSDIAIAVNDRRKNANGDWVEETSFVDVTLFGRTAEVASEYLSKGSPIFVEGRLKQDRWEKEGQKFSKLKVICDRMQLIGGRDGGGSSGGSGSRSAAQTSPATDRVSENAARGESTPSGQGDAQPTGEGDGYGDADIPF